jgi:DNA gyrase subunit A
MIGFGIDEIQAEFVAEIKLRNINREYILRRVAETEELAKEIEDLEDTLKNRRRIRSIIIDELKQVMKKYPSPRHTALVYAGEVEEYTEDTAAEDYPVHLFLSRHGYFKKITPQSLRMSGEQKYKEDDGLSQYFETTNRSELLIFTDKAQVYYLRVSEFADSKASALGEFLPTALGMDEGESVVSAVPAGDYRGTILLFFRNGKCARFTLDAYATKTKRKRATGAFSDKSPLVCVMPLPEDTEVAVFSGEDRCVVFSTALLAPKTSRTTQGVQVMTLKKHPVTRVLPLGETAIKNLSRYRVRSIPATGAKLTEADRGEEQLSMLGDEM